MDPNTNTSGFPVSSSEPGEPDAIDLYGAEVEYPSLPSPDQVRALRGRRALEEPPRADVNLDVPFVHQLWDTPDDFDGHWACGACSATMVLAYYGLLEPRPIDVSQPEPHQSDYGWYLNHTFSHNGHTFDAQAATKHGMVPGIYGTVLDRIGSGWGAHWHSERGHGLAPLMNVFLPPVGNRTRIKTKPKRNGSRFLERASAEETMKTCLDSGHPLIVSGFFNNRLDHLIVVRGYYDDPAAGGLQWIVNDPYGFETDRSFDGRNVVYRYDEINPKWLGVFEGSLVPEPKIETGNVAVRLFDPASNSPVGEGTFIRGTDKVYIKSLKEGLKEGLGEGLTGGAAADRGPADPLHHPVRLFDPAGNEPVGEGTLIRGTDKVYIKRLD